MENINFLENLATRLGQNATVKNVYGEPVIAGDKTIVPVAQVAYGFGGGYGHKPKKFLNREQGETQTEKTGEGIGGGGGIVAKPKGVYEISKDGTKFIPANYTKKLIAALLIGFFIRAVIGKKKHQ